MIGLVNCLTNQFAYVKQCDWFIFALLRIFFTLAVWTYGRVLVQSPDRTGGDLTGRTGLILSGLLVVDKILEIYFQVRLALGFLFTCEIVVLHLL